MTWKILMTGVLSILMVTALASSRFSLARKRRRAPETIMTPSEMVGLQRGRPEWLDLTSDPIAAWSRATELEKLKLYAQPFSRPPRQQVAAFASMIDWRRRPSSGRPRRSEDHVTPAQSPVKRNLASGLGRRQRLGFGLAGTGRRASQTTK